ncbi:MAG: hypothetical protein ABSB76_01795 [Streptosporangiaceae bacterium]
MAGERVRACGRTGIRSVSDLERGINRTARRDTAVLLAGALGLPEPERAVFVAAARDRAPAAEVLAALRGETAVPGGLASGREPQLAAGALGPGSQRWPRRVIQPAGGPVREPAMQLADLAGVDPVSVYRSHWAGGRRSHHGRHRHGSRRERCGVQPGWHAGGRRPCAPMWGRRPRRTGHSTPRANRNPVSAVDPASLAEPRCDPVGSPVGRHVW